MHRRAPTPPLTYFSPTLSPTAPYDPRGTTATSCRGGIQPRVPTPSPTPSLTTTAEAVSQPQHQAPPQPPPLELELELIQSHMAQKPVLRSRRSFQRHRIPRPAPSPPPPPPRPLPNPSTRHPCRRRRHPATHAVRRQPAAVAASSRVSRLLRSPGGFAAPKAPSRAAADVLSAAPFPLDAPVLSDTAPRLPLAHALPDDTPRRTRHDGNQLPWRHPAACPNPLAHTLPPPQPRQEHPPTSAAAATARTFTIDAVP